MPLELRPDVHVALVDADVVLLDVAADAYVCLPGAAGAWREGGEAAEQLAADLCERGLGGDGAGIGRRPPDLPGADLREDRVQPATWQDRRRLAAAMADLLVHYRGRSFRRIVGYVAASSPSATSVDRAELQRLSQVFAGAAPWLPAPGKCLVRSFLLMRFLGRSGVAADWVFGVRTWPFSAHCWVQAGPYALEDAPERLAAYTPIMAI